MKIKLVSAVLSVFMILSYSDVTQAQLETEIAAAATPQATPAVTEPVHETPDITANGGDLITVDFNKADIQSVFRVLSLKGNVNIVAGPEVTGEVSIQLKDVPWVNAFDTIVKTYGYTYEQTGNIYHVLTPESFKARTAVGTQTDVVTLQFANISQVATALKNAVPDIKIESLLGTNQILIMGTPSNIRAAKEVLTNIDKRLPQVHIDAKIVRTSLNKSENLGINWNPVMKVTGAKRPTTIPFATDAAVRLPERVLENSTINVIPAGLTGTQSTTSQTSGGGQSTTTTQEFPFAKGFPFVKTTDFTFGTIDFTQFTVIMSMLKSRANTKIISNPRIVVLNHQEARVQAGKEIGLPKFERNESTGAFEITGYESRNDGIQLKVTPHISSGKEILLIVKPELTRFLGFLPVMAGSNVMSPSFESTVAETQVMINSSDTLVIGGLISDAEGDTRNKVPYLSAIPLAGWLFKNTAPTRERTETIIFVTVTLGEDVFNKKAIDEWRKQQDAYEAFRKSSEDDFLRRGEGKKKGEKEPEKF